MPLATVYTPRLVIRPLKAADAVEVYNLGQQSHVASAMPNLVYDDPDELVAELAFYDELATTSDRISGPLYWAIIHRKTGGFIGHIGLSPYQDDVEIAYAIGVDHCGMGFASEAVSALSQNWLEHEQERRIYGVTDDRNVASARVLEKSGFMLLERGKLLLRGQSRTGRKYVRHS